MTETPAYVLVGRGRWAKKIQPILAAEGRTVATVEETRQRSSETTPRYLSRLSKSMKASRAQIAWLCVLPGPHVFQMIQAALEAGLHVVAEKPWYGSEADTERLQGLARTRRRLIAVDFEYLVHQEVRKWKEIVYPGTGMRFGGHFFLSRPDHTGIPASDNLGSHLMAIREFAAPAAEVCELQCGYERPGERTVWLERSMKRVASIDLLKGSERIIQDFIREVEAALDGGAFPFGLDLALRVEHELKAYTRNAVQNLFTPS